VGRDYLNLQKIRKKCHGVDFELFFMLKQQHYTLTKVKKGKRLRTPLINVEDCIKTNLLPMTGRII